MTEPMPPPSPPVAPRKPHRENYPAAWRAPSPEDTPRPLARQQKLSGAGFLLEVDFVSLVEDERQLQRFP